jgi:cytochrome c biogenesis protein
VTIDGAEVFLAGVRASPNDPFSYLRIPSDEAHTVKEWMRLRAALADKDLRELAAQRYARRAMPSTGNSPAAALAGQLQDSASKSLAIFAGEGKDGGYAAVSRFLEKIPTAEQEKAANIFMKILNGSLWELWQAAREKEGLAPVAGDEKQARFLQLATNALSDSFFYGAPVYLQLDEFVEVKASVLQVTRSPGKAVVYLGCVFLVLGVFAMFYIRERRLWVWVRDGEPGGPAHALMAMSTQRKTLDFEHEFNDLKAKLPQLA